MSISQPDLTIPDLSFEMINVDNHLYIKEAGFEPWAEATPEEIGDDASLDMTPDKLNQINEHFVNIYNQLPMEKVGTVEIDGVNATKYTLSLDNETTKDLIPEELLGESMELETVFDHLQLNLEMAFYLNEQNQIIKETLIFHENFEIEEEEMTLDMSMDVNFKNIGAEIKITAPEIEQIEVPTN
jgi:hypothetical protein